MTRAKGKSQTKGRRGMTVITLPNGCTITTDAEKAERFENELRALDLMPGSLTTYFYEDVDGTKIPVKFVGWDNLNLRLLKLDGSIKQVPVIDMGDGSLVTDWLQRSHLTDAEFCTDMTQRIRQQLLDLGEFSREACESVHVHSTGAGRFKLKTVGTPEAEVQRLLDTLVTNGLMTDPVPMPMKQGLTGNYGVN